MKAGRPIVAAIAGVRLYGRAMRDLVKPFPRAGQAWAVAVLAVAASALTAVPAGAVHESHHGPFVGRTSQGERLVMRVIFHTRLGIRFRWRASCQSGSVSGIARFRNVAVDRDGRFFKRNRTGVGVRGKIGFDPQGNPVFPKPFSFANNEAKGRLRAIVDTPGNGRCRSGTVSWDARR
jgi:hypothetical protein